MPYLPNIIHESDVTCDRCGRDMNQVEDHYECALCGRGKAILDVSTKVAQAISIGAAIFSSVDFSIPIDTTNLSSSGGDT